MAIEDLVTVFAPPKSPQDAEGDWDEVEAKLGVSYPSDFRKLISTYGTGEFLNGLLLFNPLNPWCLEEIPRRLRRLREMRDGEALAGAIHPEPSGFFPWGSDVNGNEFCWLTEGEPHRWPVVLLAHGYEDQPVRVNEDATTFLANYARNKHPKLAGGIVWEDSQLRFEPGFGWQQ